MFKYVLRPFVSMLWQMTIMAICVTISFGVGGLLAVNGYEQYAPWASMFIMIWLGGLIIGLARNSKGIV